ncbi:hypothetical protein C8R44DRAFT_846890 [Mycena epipterygia]|nr:hypothetical protein C8R44DRAFT_846890 [Mycena epipterygia]
MSSPFASKLGTNYCPEDEEITEIKAFLEPVIRLQCLDDEIADLQKTINKLAKERASIGAYVEAHKALISPVRRLPLDLIQEIFVACLLTHRNCVMSALEAPVLLGRICSSWREISLSTPRLCSRLYIVEPKRPFGSTSTLDARLAQRLETTKMWLASPAPPNHFIQALIPFACRWQHIHFTALTSEFKKLSQLAATDVPMLHTFELYDNTQ